MDAPTPTPAKLGLASTVALTAAALVAFTVGQADGAIEPSFAAAFLYLFSALFLVRVAGQLFVRARQPSWLPPTEQWNLTPYHLLLPAQLAILGLMAWIDLDFTRDGGFWVDRKPQLGVAALWFAFAYAAAMAVRYVVRMSRRPAQRWFGGTIPIVFHWVLASFLVVLGSFHASQ